MKMTDTCPPLNCEVCGRFVGKDGYRDAYFDNYAGVWRIGNSLCRKHLDERLAKEAEMLEADEHDSK